VALVGVCHDITEQTAAAHALHISEQRVHSIIDNLPSVVSVKGLDGRYLMANHEFAALLGKESGDVLGNSCSDLFPEDISTRFLENDERAAESGEAVYDEVALLVAREWRTFATVTFPLPDERGEPHEICTIGTDITDMPERESERRERLEWERTISSALTEHRMTAFAQPVFDLASGKASGYELLVRMRAAGDSNEILTPDRFLPGAERFNLVQAIDTWMAGEALALDLDVARSVNLSAVTLCDRVARDRILGLLRSVPDVAPRLVIEITETVAAGYIDEVCAFAKSLVDLGCGLALDDFGTGFGSFTYLRRVPLRYLKIDRSFVGNLANSEADRRVVASIIGIAEQFGLHSIVEGVEDQATLEVVTELGANYVQGFLLGRPAPVAELAANPPRFR
jgi:PAS domain S-box-containing protein